MKLSLLYSNWITLWYVLYKTCFINIAPVISSVLTTCFFTLMYYNLDMSKIWFFILFCVHIITPIDLLLISKNNKYNVSAEVYLFLFYNIFIIILYNTNFIKIYFNNLPQKFKKNKNVSITQLLYSLKI